MPSELYFAYGSNMHGAQMAHRCPGSEPLECATLYGWALTFGGWSVRWDGPVADITQDQWGWVRGALYRISDLDLLSLDAYEGVPTAYWRFPVAVELDAGQCVTAWTYQRSTPSMPASPSNRYLAAIWMGYRSWGVDSEELLQRARGAGWCGTAQTLLDSVRDSVHRDDMQTHPTERSKR